MMQGNFKVLGISFKNAPILVREALAFDESSSKQFMLRLKELLNVNEVLVLSTCNRTEIYFSSDEEIAEEILKVLAHYKGFSDSDSFKDFFIYREIHQEAIVHLFYVAMGLEAQVVGDMQISNQVKNAYQWSADEGMAGPFLHRLMHTIFFTNKRVVQETPFRDGAASVSYVATELVTELTHNFQSPNILVLGLGEMGADVCRNLEGVAAKDVTIANRTYEKAVDIAEECGHRAVPFDDALSLIATSDVIISSVAHSTPIITKSLVANVDILSYKFFIDLSVPRSVAPDVEDIPAAVIYNIDNIQSKASKALEKRVRSIPAVKAIVHEAIEEFNTWSKEMAVSPTINKFKNALEQIRKEELARHLKNTDLQSAEVIDKITKSMMQKIIKLPVLQLKAACQRGEAETLIDVLSDLFDLEKHSEKINK